MPVNPNGTNTKKTYLGIIKFLKIKDKVVILKAAAGGRNNLTFTRK